MVILSRPRMGQYTPGELRARRCVKVVVCKFFSIAVMGRALRHATDFAVCSNRLAIMTAEDSSSQQAQQPGTPTEPRGGLPHQKELDAIYLVLDCIIDLGLGDRGINKRD